MTTAMQMVIGYDFLDNVNADEAVDKVQSDDDAVAEMANGNDVNGADNDDGDEDNHALTF